MRLIERGIFDIDNDISEYLIGYEVPTYDGNKHKITLRQLLSHHAGLNLHGFAGYQQGQRIPTVEQILRGAFPSNHLKLKMIKNPETGFQYSGGGYILAQKIVTDVCNREFNDVMNDLVLSPFSMMYSTFSQPLPIERINEIAFGYSPHSLQLHGGYCIMPELSAAGLWTTPSDLARFGIEFMKALKNESDALKKDTAELMVTEAYDNSPYGIGFRVIKGEKGLSFGHNGSNFGYLSNMEFFPDNGSGMVVMLNSSIGMDVGIEVSNAIKETYNW